MKKLLLVNHQTPHGKATAQESLDVALIAAAFDQEISLLFMDDGLYQLKKDQKPENISRKNFAEGFKALFLYGINQVYVAEKSLQERQLTSDDFLVDTKALNNKAIAELMAKQDIILHF